MEPNYTKGKILKFFYYIIAALFLTAGAYVFYVGVYIFGAILILFGVVFLKDAIRKTPKQFDEQLKK